MAWYTKNNSPKIIPEKNSVDIWDLVICTGQTSMYILNTFPSTLTSQMAKNHKDKMYTFFEKIPYNHTIIF